MFKKSPYKRAIDIEKSIQELKNKVGQISEVPFDLESDSDNEIVKKSFNCIVQSLHTLINHLKLKENSRIKNGLPNILNRKLTSNVRHLRDVSKVIGTLNEIQSEAIELVVENHKTFREGLEHKIRKNVFFEN